MWMLNLKISFDTYIVIFYKEKNKCMDIASNIKWVSHQLGFVFMAKSHAYTKRDPKRPELIYKLFIKNYS